MPKDERQYLYVSSRWVACFVMPLFFVVYMISRWSELSIRHPISVRCLDIVSRAWQMSDNERRSMVLAAGLDNKRKWVADSTMKQYSTAAHCWQRAAPAGRCDQVRRRSVSHLSALCHRHAESTHAAERRVDFIKWGRWKRGSGQRGSGMCFDKYSPSCVQIGIAAYIFQTLRRYHWSLSLTPALFFV